MVSGKDKARLLEVCCGDMDSVDAAWDGGADRVELCSALSEGGVTPSLAFFNQVKAKYPSLKCHILIRHRGGDFFFSDDETEIMCRDIDLFRQAGADGVVIGALNHDFTIDKMRCKMMIDRAGDMNVTFNRAFDLTPDMKQALEDVIDLGCSRVLTSGGAPDVFKGIDSLRDLNKLSFGRIIILAGCGVTPDNLLPVLTHTGIKEIHASARDYIQHTQLIPNTGVYMGEGDKQQASRKSTSPLIVRKLKEIINSTY